MKFAAMRGTLPASWGALAGLTRLSLSGLFTGSLPPAWAGLSALRELRLAGANITAGGLPAEWSALTGLTVCAGGGTLHVAWGTPARLRVREPGAHNKKAGTVCAA